MAALRAPVPSEQESVGALVQRLGTDVTRIVRAEIALLQLRVTTALHAVKAAGGGIAAAVVLALTGFGTVMAGVVIVLANVMPAWAAAFSVGGGLLVIAAVLLVVGRRTLTHGVSEALSPIDGEVFRESRHGE